MITGSDHIRVPLLALAVALAAALLMLVSTANPGEAAFPGENGKIAFNSLRDGNYEIYTMNGDGTSSTRLTYNSHVDVGPSFSGDGANIAFMSNRDGNYEVYRMSASGGSLTRLTNNSGFDGQPSYSPDGTQIAFASNRPALDGSTDSDIWVMNADGSGTPRNLTNNSVHDDSPEFSPDGTKIAFESDRDGGDRDIYVMNADGSGQMPLTNNSSVSDGQLDFSPNGSNIVFVSNRVPPPVPWELFVMDAKDNDGDGNGDNLRRLTTSSALERAPAYSPDGTKIVFENSPSGANVGDEYEIFVMNNDGSGRMRLTNNSVSDGDADWGVVYNAPPDTTPPTINVPNDITVDATSPDGEGVSYEVTVTDDGDPNPTLSCDPASDSIFPIGTTTVECTATDSSGNSANASFNVIVRGAAELISTLKETVANLGLQTGLNQSLQAKLDDALAHANAGRTVAACNKLNDFNSQVSVQSGRQIDPEAAESLTTDANRIKAVLGCK